jgi:nucleotide-binding universal stress UspA family protein
MVAFLAFRKISATAVGVGQRDWSGEDLIDVAVAHGAGLLVMGAHCYMGSEALGTATRRVLAATPLPVLLAA